MNFPDIPLTSSPSTQSAVRTHNPPVVKSPGEFIACIPGILGFYPHDSLVLLGLKEVDAASTTNSTQFELGPVARLDIGDARALGEAASVLASTDCRVVFAVLVASEKTEKVHDFADLLYTFADSGGIDINACWYLPEITVGESYEQWFGTGLYSTANGGGTLPSPTTSPSFESLMNTGELPALNRKEYVEKYSKKNPQLDAATIAEITALGQKLSDELADVKQIELGDEGYQYTLAQVRADATEVCAEIGSKKDAQDLATNEAFLLEAAIWLSNVHVRDIVCAVFADYPEEAASVLRVVFETFDGEIRANALTLYAICCKMTGNSIAFNSAMACVREEFSGHRLSFWISEYYEYNGFERIPQILRDGSEAAVRAHL